MKPVIRNKRKKHKMSSQRLIFVIIVEVCILVMMSFAWYYFQAHRVVYSENRDVMPPYCLYLLEPNGTDSLNLTVGNLHPGETKQIIIGVSNKAPNGESSDYFKIGRDSKFNYELEVAYTKNLPVYYKVYELIKSDGASGPDSVTLSWKAEDDTLITQDFMKTVLNKTDNSEDITNQNNLEMYQDKLAEVVNLGQYDIYNNSSGASFDLTTNITEGGVVEFDMDYYLVEINWQDGIIFSDYLKETDLVYIIVNAIQLEPNETALNITP